jgi:hypothetical protein
MECQIVDEEGNAIYSANAGELVYFKSTYAYSKSKKMAWNLMVTLPSVDMKNYKTSMKHNGYFFHEASLVNKSRLIPIAIPNESFIEGNATFKYTLTSNGSCYAYLNLVPQDIQDIRGTYVLDSFIVKYSNGQVITDDDITANGSWIIGDGFMNQNMLVGNIQISMSGTYSLFYTNGTTEGYFRVTDTTGTHDIYFWISGNQITTYSGVISLGNGITYEEWDTWTKMNNYIQGVSSQDTEKQRLSGHSNFQWIGDILIKNNLIPIK